jgi:alpha-D-ribose 1-methylphosphonate 5-triphosphate diphosphatase PhnM
MGAPNLVRGGSHSGNVSALTLAREDLLDCLSSDYFPHALLHAAYLLRDLADWTLPKAIATTTRNPARMLGLTDRGEIAPSADLCACADSALGFEACLSACDRARAGASRKPAARRRCCPVPCPEGG